MKKIFSHPFFKETLAYAKAHKVIAGIAAIAVLYAGYWSYSALTTSAAATRYVTMTVQKDTLISSVTGTGQISTSNQVDLKAQASGAVTYLPVIQGQQVKAGTLIAQLDRTDALKSVRDAEVSLQSSQLALQKLQQPATTLSLTQMQDALAKAEQSKLTAQQSLAQDYDSGFNSVSSAFIDLPTIMTGLQNLLYTTSSALGGSQYNINYYGDTINKTNPEGQIFATDADTKYKAALAAYNKNFSDYKAASRFSDTATIDSLISETYTTAKTVSDAIKSANNLIQLYKDTLAITNTPTSPLADTQLTTLSTYTSKSDADIGTLLSSQTALKNDANAIVNADQSITESTQSLAQLQAGADQITITSAELDVKSKQNALLDAQENLAHSSIVAPFDGTVAKIDVQKTDQVSSGETVATMITQDMVAVIPLNEVDIAKVAVGQKVTVTFDAISDLTIAGEVTSVDTLGTVSQGVVTYNVTVKLLTTDPRVKSGMSVSVAIVTDVEQDVLDVPNSAIKTSGNSSYVLVFDQPLAGGESTTGATSATAPRQQAVVLGTSNDTSTVITSGLKEGDTVVVRTISASAATASTAASATSLLGGSRGGIGGGGATRALTGGGRGN